MILKIVTKMMMKKNKIYKITNYFAKFWYSLPRFKFTFNIKKYYLDKRSFEWYLQRKLFGFDETVLWTLSAHLEAIIKIRLNLPKAYRINSTDFKAWFKNDEFVDDVKWFSERVNKYIEWECPYYLPFVSKYIENQEEHKKEILSKYKVLLNHRLSGGNILDAEINFLHKNNIFGW